MKQQQQKKTKHTHHIDLKKLIKKKNIIKNPHKGSAHNNFNGLPEPQL